MGTRSYYVYILASRIGGTLYIGVTNDLVRRVYEHRTDAVPRFTRKYKVHRLVYYEIHDDIIAAIAQEKGSFQAKPPPAARKEAGAALDSVPYAAAFGK